MLDLIIIIFILFGGLIGFKRGIIKQSVVTIGMVLVLVLSFILKNPVSAFMYKNFPFFSFNGLYKNISVINILVYELIAFFVVFSLLSIILIILTKISSVMEKLLRVTIILAIPSKILGLILGFVEYYIVAFVVLFALAQPIFNLNDRNWFKESQMKDIMFEKTPIISKYVSKTTDSFYEVSALMKNKKNYSDKKMNCEITKMMLKNKIIKKDSLDYLYSSGKIKYKCN